MITLPALKCFQVAARTQNFTKAAKMLNISQPALSHLIKQLQDEIGCPLFNYKGRGVELNSYGKILLEYVDDSMEILDNGIQRINDLVHPELGTVRVSCLYSMGVNLLPNIIKDFKQDYPNVTVNLIQHATHNQLRLLKNGNIDLCFCSDFDFGDSAEFTNLEKIPVLIEDLYILVNKNHRLAKYNEIPLSEIDGEDFISYNDLTLIKKNLNDLFEKFNIHPNVVFEANEDSSVAGFVATGMGIAVIPPVVGVDFSKCKPLKISYPLCQRRMSMMWDKNINQRPVIQNFRDYVIKWLPSDKTFHSDNYPR